MDSMLAFNHASLSLYFTRTRCSRQSLYNFLYLQKGYTLISICFLLYKEENPTLSDGGTSLTKYSPIPGIFWIAQESEECSCCSSGSHTCIMSFLTLGTSEKKKRAKTPATAPNDPAVIPLRDNSSQSYLVH